MILLQYWSHQRYSLSSYSTGCSAFVDEVHCAQSKDTYFSCSQYVDCSWCFVTPACTTLYNVGVVYALFLYKLILHTDCGRWYQVVPQVNSLIYSYLPHVKISQITGMSKSTWNLYLSNDLLVSLICEYRFSLCTSNTISTILSADTRGTV
jgi:hypothetical protein